MDELLQRLSQEIKMMRRRIEELEASERNNNYLGISSGDFTTTTLPNHGDYGFQTTDNEIQINCNGTIRAITTSTL